MPKRPVDDEVAAAVKALNQAENAIEPLEMHYLASPSVAPAYVYWAWAALTLGAIMLVGIVTKNGIVMVDYMNLLIERGSGVFDAVIAGGKSRLRPVLMTSFTTILGMLPLAIGTGAGSETWQPMGIAVIGGLTFSTILTLFIVPVLYSILVNRSQRKEREKLARLSAEHQASKH